jgi:hypothetical protein
MPSKELPFDPFNSEKEEEVPTFRKRFLFAYYLRIAKNLENHLMARLLAGLLVLLHFVWSLIALHASQNQGNSGRKNLVAATTPFLVLFIELLVTSILVLGVVIKDLSRKGFYLWNRNSIGLLL